MNYEAMTLAQYRQQILQEFEAIGVLAFVWHEYKKESPCVVLFNDNPLIEAPDVDTFAPGVWKVNMYLVLRAERQDGDVATEQLDNLIAQTLEIVGDLDDVQVGNLGVIENEEKTYAATVSFSKTFEIRKEHT